MGRTKPGTAQYTGAPAGARLIGSSPHNKGILLDVAEEQKGAGNNRISGEFTLIDAGEGKYASFLATMTCRQFHSASELVDAIRSHGAAKCTHIVNRNCLKLASAPGPAAWPADLQYDVALSFAGEDRATAQGLVRLLSSRHLSVFYDEYERANLWGKDLYQHLAKVYADYSRFCVIFISKAYSRKLWTQHELRNAQARAFRANSEYLLPVRLDDTSIPGIPETAGYIDARAVPLTDIAESLFKKIRNASGSPGRPQLPSLKRKAVDSPLPSDRRKAIIGVAVDYGKQERPWLLGVLWDNPSQGSSRESPAAIDSSGGRPDSASAPSRRTPREGPASH